jgi:hypothetical protein
MKKFIGILAFLFVGISYSCRHSDKQISPQIKHNDSIVLRDPAVTKDTLYTGSDTVNHLPDPSNDSLLIKFEPSNIRPNLSLKKGGLLKLGGFTFGDPDTYNPNHWPYVSMSEYYPSLYYGYKMYNNLNVASPALYTGEPDSVADVVAGAHDALCWNMEGGLYVTGSIFGTSEFALVHETTDSAGNPIAPIVQASYGTAWGSEEWNVGVVGSDGSLEEAGDLTGGVRGNGTGGPTSQTTFVKPVFYRSTFFTKVQMGLAVTALDTVNGGSVWTWGGNNGGGGGGSLTMIGRGNSPIRSFTVPDTVAIPSAAGRAIDIAGWGWWTFILTSNHHLLFIGEQSNYAIGTTFGSSNSPQDISSTIYSTVKNSAGQADSIYKIGINSCGTYVITKSGALWFWGSGVTGGAGNGNMANWPTYMSGGHIYPYNYDGGFGEVMTTPVHIAPGINDWVTIRTNACYTFGVTFGRAGGRQYALARNKADNFWLPTIQAGYIIGAIPSGYPDSWDWAYLVEIIGPEVSGQPYGTTYQVTCPYCQPNNSINDTCSTYTNPAHTPPTASLTGFASSGVIYLSGTGTTPGPHVTHIYDYTLTQTNPSGDPAVLDMGIQAAGANASGINDTISTAAGQPIPSGSYHFTLRNRNISWDSTAVNLTVTVNNNCKCLILSCNCAIGINNINYEKDFDPSRHADALFAKRPEPMSWDAMYGHPHSSG